MDEDVRIQTLPEIKAGGFEGPLDLLCFLIEKNKVNIYRSEERRVGKQCR